MLYDMSFANTMLYSKVVPVVGSADKRDSETYDGDDPSNNQRLEEIAAYEK